MRNNVTSSCSSVVSMRCILLLVLFGISGLTLAEEKPCTAHTQDGKYYNLNNLKRQKDFELKTSGGRALSINVCQGVTTELWGLKGDIKSSEVAAFVHLDHGAFAIGKVNTTLTVIDSRPRLVLSDGSSCKATPGGSDIGLKASTIIEFICDTSIFGAGQPRLVGQLPPGDDDIGCAYVIEWGTHFACPTSENGGVWGFFSMLAVAVLILLLTYTVLGTLYNRYVLQLRGFDQIPQFSIESMNYHSRQAADWIKDIMSAYNIGGTREILPYDSQGVGATNPVSHHNQTSEEFNINQNNTLVRPQLSTPRSPPRSDMNPVSHHAQMQTEIQRSRSSVQIPPKTSPKQPHPQFSSRRVDLGSRGPTQEEREFLLGHDEEEGELKDKLTPITFTATHPPAEDSVNATPQSDCGNANMAAIRGRGPK